MEARVVSFESIQEVERVFDHMSIGKWGDFSILVLTSAMSFKMPNTSDSQWIYLGTSKYRYATCKYKATLNITVE